MRGSWSITSAPGGQYRAFAFSPLPGGCRAPDSGGRVQHHHLPAPLRDPQGAHRPPGGRVAVQDGAVADGPGSAPRSGWRFTASITPLRMRKAIRTAPGSKASGTCSSGTSTTTSAEIKKTDVVARYARDIKDGWWDTYMFNHGLLGLGIGTALLCLIVGPVIGVGWALLAAGIHAVMYVFVLSSSINGAVPPRRLQELRQHGDQHPRARPHHRR